MFELVLYAAAMLLCFVLLARIVDKFFVVSLDRISHDWKLSSDAAGATLMAVGSSAPELFVALFAVLKPGDHDAIGIGSIVGSALFNLLAIGGIVALVRKSTLTWQPMVRDILFYFVAVVLLLWGIIDGNFSIVDSLLFLGLYAVYVFAVVRWRRWFSYKDNGKDVEQEAEVDEKPNFIDRILGIFFPKPEHYYWVFFISILLIAGMSWVLVESAIHVSHVLNIPESIIALTVLAAGTSIPDLISSMVVAKQGRGDMAISNAIGSNIFDILVGLGFPFLLVMLISGTTIETGGHNLESSSIALFASLIAFTLLLVAKRWKINWFTGIVLLLLYIVYLTREIILL
ncbi:calcium/sodium antiporter [Mangrovibacterium diazotrophicum]|uniref:K+-dependent Na+/Ca+ exchanger-like protein n=1 Tax=Mangrovibacterium diazotrophicum TaxID=1261403 RepID=A0A419W8K0_9BACT|nr:calcium/sodium antiporter [Mangrovibacterium diazotrophicum]RKD91692.1 K+-dependent Na+/Ca+ exchanger-like protein [Mangrovibacterium diazotrophicum]